MVSIISDHSSVRLDRPPRQGNVIISILGHYGIRIFQRERREGNAAWFSVIAAALLKRSRIFILHYNAPGNLPAIPTGVGAGGVAGLGAVGGSWRRSLWGGRGRDGYER